MPRYNASPRLHRLTRDRNSDYNQEFESMVRRDVARSPEGNVELIKYFVYGNGKDIDLSCIYYEETRKLIEAARLRAAKSNEQQNEEDSNGILDQIVKLMRKENQES